MSAALLFFDKKNGARVMLIHNTNVQDKMSNGQVGTVDKIVVDENNSPYIIFVRFDDPEVGAMTREEHKGLRDGEIRGEERREEKSR